MLCRQARWIDMGSSRLSTSSASSSSLSGTRVSKNARPTSSTRLDNRRGSWETTTSLALITPHVEQHSDSAPGSASLLTAVDPITENVMEDVAIELVHQNSLNISTDASTARQGADDALTVKAASCEPHPDIECLQDEDDLDVFRYSASTLDDPESYILDIMPSEADITVKALEEPDWNQVWDISVLQIYYRQYREKKHLILDSHAPHSVPHIVITPPEYNYYDDFVAWANRIDTQRVSCLVVPPINVSEARMPMPPSPAPDHAAPAATPMPESTTSAKVLANLRSSPPKAVFSHTKFASLMETSSTERLVFYHIVIALHRHVYKAAVFAASRIACSFRRRYDSPAFIDALEKPFTWTDPAEPILAKSKPIFGTLILDSPFPFRIPHIIVTGPPPEDPMVAWANATNSPQDLGFGRHLVVPNRSSYINYPDEQYDDFFEHPISDYSVSEDTDDAAELSSLPATPLPSTPSCSDFPDSFAQTISGPGWAIEDDEDTLDDPECYRSEFLSYHDGLSGGVETHAYVKEDRAECAARPSCDIFSPPWDDDDDDLPPLDDWYTSIIQRTQTI